MQQIMKKIQINGKLKVIDSTFVLKTENKTLKFVHLTYEENIQSIKENGFYKGNGIFGEGLYVCDLESEESVKSLIDFSADLIEDRHDDLVVIEGRYLGEYDICIDTKEYFDYAKGFVLIKDVEKIKIKSISLIEYRLLKGYIKKLNKNLIL